MQSSTGKREKKTGGLVSCQERGVLSDYDSYPGLRFQRLSTALESPPQWRCCVVRVAGVSELRRRRNGSNVEIYVGTVMALLTVAALRRIAGMQYRCVSRVSDWTRNIKAIASMKSAIALLFFTNELDCFQRRNGEPSSTDPAQPGVRAHRPFQIYDTTFPHLHIASCRVAVYTIEPPVSNALRIFRSHVACLSLM